MRRLFARLHREPTTELRAYESFGAALRDSDSYEDPRLVDVVKEKTRRYRESLAQKPPVTTRQMVQNLFVLSYVEPQLELSVLEIGGACGASYFEMESLLPGRVGHWSIVETPAMAAAGESNAKLSFHSDIGSATNKLASRDLAIAQGALQYAGDPSKTLADLCALQISYIYVTRTAVANAEAPIFTKQVTAIAAHGPGRLPNAPDGSSSQPMTLVSFEALLGALPSNYEIIFKFEEGEERTVSVGGRLVTIRDIGFLARLAK
ncbi:MAG TPA: methyltransferase, TIGR04325 family [Pyrinomonadaceae bacterium]|nr:methyltransferase, TIGR04325 family [Pyrinomonadaceae bacterium]